MLRSKLVPSLALLLVLAAPSLGAASPHAGPPREEPDGRLAAALSDLRDLIAALWTQPAVRGTVTAAAESDGSGGTGGPGGEGHSGQDPNGAQEDPDSAEGPPAPPAGGAG